MDAYLPLLTNVIATAAGAVVIPLEYPIERVLTIRQAQGSLIGYKYSNIISCLRSMPGEQGGFRNVWRGLGPFLFTRVGTRPFQFTLNQQISNITPNSHASGVAERMIKNFAIGGITGGIVNLVFHPFKVASLKLQLDLGGGTLGSRASYQNTFEVLKQISQNAGIFSLPFTLKGSIYRGVTATTCHSILKNGVYFGLYDTIRPLLMTDQDSSRFLKQFLAGIACTNLADFVCYPIRTAIVRSVAAVSPAVSLKGVTSPVEYRGALDAIVKVTKKEGFTALWRGFGLNLARSLSGTFLLIFYDSFKYSS